MYFNPRIPQCICALGTHHDSLVTHVQLGLAWHQGGLVLLHQPRDALHGPLVFLTGKTGTGETQELLPGLHCGAHITRLAHKTFPGPQRGRRCAHILPAAHGSVGKEIQADRVQVLCLGQRGWQWLVLPRNQLAPGRSAFQTAGPGAPEVSSPCRSAASSCGFPREWC